VWQWRHGRSVPANRKLSALCRWLTVKTSDLLPEEAGSGRKNARNALTRWLQSIGLWGCGADGKFVPDCIFTAPRESVALFLNRLFATDGWATVLSSGQAQLGDAAVKFVKAGMVLGQAVAGQSGS
jgi:replicative DNA helicase